MSIVVNQLTKTYGQQKALKNISFTAKVGEIVGFLGPNGAGKSTTMKILSGFIPPSSGLASVCGFDVLTHPREARRRIGYLPEHNPLYLDLYVQESLCFMARMHQLPHPKQRVREVIEQVGLENEQHKKIINLSKGYRQRVGLAQAILHDPEVLILDEPTSGLDPNQMIAIRQLIKNFGKVKTVMLSTHMMQEVELLCDRVLILHKGTLLEDNLIEDLKKKYHRRTLEDIFVDLTK